MIQKLKEKIFSQKKNKYINKITVSESREIYAEHVTLHVLLLVIRSSCTKCSATFKYNAADFKYSSHKNGTSFVSQ